MIRFVAKMTCERKEIDLRGRLVARLVASLAIRKVKFMDEIIPSLVSAM